MMVKNIKLEIDFTEFLNADYNSHSGSCIFHQKRENKDIYKKHKTSFPETYEETNTIIHQVWWDSQELKDKLGELLDMDVKTISTIQQDPGNTIPVHKDKFYLMGKEFPNDNRTKVRANIFLEDWKMGHFLQYNDVIAPKWKAGEGYMWDSEVDHLSCNAGLDPKYTLQISGFLNE